MLDNLDSNQRALAKYMSAISEQAFSAGWMEDLEHVLWRAASEGPFRYGRLDLSVEHSETLKKLSEACGGWILFDETPEEVFVPAQKWIAIYDRWRAL